MKLTEKQQTVLNVFNNGSYSKKEALELLNGSMNIISLGLVLNNLISANLISFDGETYSKCEPDKNILLVGKKKYEKTIVYDGNKSDSEMTLPVQDFDQNMFFELAEIGMKFNPENYNFSTNDKGIFDKGREIIEFYTCSPTNMTKGQRDLRDKISDKHNLDMFVKRVDSQMHFCNTWGIADMSVVKRELKKLGKKIISESKNRIVIEVGD